MLAAAEGTPTDEGESVFVTMCSGCHDLETAVSVRGDEQDWAWTVDEMIGRGAMGTDEEIETVIAYLAKNFPPPVNVNKATADELENGLSLSAKDAGALVSYRTEHGPIQGWEDLEKIPGLDIDVLEERRAAITF